jgi:hypothetical protein
MPRLKITRFFLFFLSFCAFAVRILHLQLLGCNTCFALAARRHGVCHLCDVAIRCSAVVLRLREDAQARAYLDHGTIEQRRARSQLFLCCQRSVSDPPPPHTHTHTQLSSTCARVYLSVFPSLALRSLSLSMCPTITLICVGTRSTQPHPFHWCCCQHFPICVVMRSPNADISLPHTCCCQHFPICVVMRSPNADISLPHTCWC